MNKKTILYGMTCLGALVITLLGTALSSNDSTRTATYWKEINTQIVPGELVKEIAFTLAPNETFTGHYTFQVNDRKGRQAGSFIDWTREDDYYCMVSNPLITNSSQACNIMKSISSRDMLPQRFFRSASLK